MTQNNNIIEGTVETIAFGGNGIIRDQGMVVFVPGAAIGDRLKVRVTKKKKRFASGCIVDVLKEGPNRAEPRCPHYGRCAGCQLQHLSYPEQIAAKRQFIVDAFERIAKIPIDFPLKIVGATEQRYYRRHITLTLKQGQLGYIGEESQEFIPIQECSLFLPHLKEIQTLCGKLGGEGKLQVIKVENDKLICHFHFPRSIPENFRESTENLSWLKGTIAQTPSQNIQIGEVHGSYDMLGLRIQYSSRCFLQNHSEMSEAIYHYIEELVRQLRPKNILDLYSGIGITSLLFGRLGIPTIGVEINPHSVRAAIHNAKENLITPASFVCADAGKALTNNENADCVFLNPPRTGLNKKVLEMLVQQSPTHILYLSCMPSTLARDIAQLTRNGYKISSAQGFDMFPQTTHVETVVLLDKYL